MASNSLEKTLPSVARYKRAFQAIRNEISPNHMALLKAIYHAPNHSITAKDMASQVGYKDYRGANLQIGRLGGILRDELSWNGIGQKSYVLCGLIPPGEQGNPEWIFVMHDAVVEALRDLKWF